MKERVFAFGTFIAINACLCLAACVGGGGAYTSDYDSWDSPPVSVERARNDRENAPPTTERSGNSVQEGTATSTDQSSAQGGGAGGASSSGGGFNCSGNFTCTEAGDDDSSVITVSSSNGRCTASDSKGKTVVVFESDGRLTVGGIVFGSWSSNGSGFTISTEDGTVNCTPGGTPKQSSSSSSSSGSSTSGSSGTSIDAGVAQPPG